MIARSRVWIAVVVATIALSSSVLGAAFLNSGSHPASTSSPIQSAATAGTVTAASSAPASTSVHQPVAPGPAAEARLMSAFKASGDNPRTFYPPNLVYAPKLDARGVIVHPSYPQAPEPAGLADYGVINTTGTPTSITINTQSYRASLTLNSLFPYYLSTGIPEGFSSQMNVVVNNVTIFGNSSYTFWLQDVAFYDAYSHQLEMENNIWNFSYDSGFAMPQQTFLWGVPGYTNGTDYPIGTENYYAAGGGEFNSLAPPITIVFYVNVTTLQLGATNYTEVDFDYDLLNATGVQTFEWMFDRVLFNNTGFSGPIVAPMIHVDGTNLTPTGFIPYDAEIMLGGPGGGSTATFQALNATMTLQHWNSTAGAYVNEPSAWSSGSETGETSVGISDYYTANGVAELGAGPEFVQPFWNSSPTAAAGAAVLSGTISPSNSWAFATDSGAYNISESAWGALPSSGNYAWNLTAGTYTVKLMESDYDAVTSSALVLTAGTTTTYSVSLTEDMTMGVYTPLYAWTNAQLAAISTGGTGTEANPYMIFNNEYTNLSGEFAAINDYGYPAYPGMSFAYTTAYVEISDPAPFAVNYWGAFLNTATYFDTPTTNDLQTWLFDTSHVSIVGGVYSGWFTGEGDGFPYADLTVWNSTDTLVTGVTFEEETLGILAYGGTANSFVGNSFYLDFLAGYNIMYALICLQAFGGCALLDDTGMFVMEGGDSIWNNYFDTTFTAAESDLNVFDDLYPTVPAVYENNWNLTAPIPAGSVTVINGISITGAVGGFPYACGNWWYDYIPGTTPLPYDEDVYGYELIANGGDYCPAGSLGAILFVESGLPSATLWSVTANGTTYSGFGTSLIAIVPTGMYDYSVGAVTGYAATPSTGTTSVGWLGAVSTVSISFSSTASKTGTLSGTVSPATATVLVDGSAVTVTAGAFSSTLTVGTHSIVASLSGYYTYYNNVTVTSGGTTTVSITLNPVTPPIGPDGTLSLTVIPNAATVWVDGSMVTLSSGMYSASVTPGVHSIVASLSGYYSYYNNVTVSSSTTSGVLISLNPVTPAPGPDGTLVVTVTTAGATLWINGVPETLSLGSYTANYAPGTPILIEVKAANYFSYYNNVTLTSGKTTSVWVSLNPVTTTTTTTSSSSGISNTGWILIGILAALAVIFLITTAIYMSRARHGGGSGDQDESSPPSGGPPT